MLEYGHLIHVETDVDLEGLKRNVLLQRHFDPLCDRLTAAKSAVDVN